MKNKRGLLFIIIFIGLTAILASRYFKITEDIYEKRNKEDNPAEKIIMTGEKSMLQDMVIFIQGFMIFRWISRQIQMPLNLERISLN